MAKRKNINKKASVASLKKDETSRPAKRVHFANELVFAIASELQPAPTVSTTSEATAAPLPEPPLSHSAKKRRNKKKVAKEDLGTPVSVESSSGSKFVDGSVALHRLPSPASSSDALAIDTSVDNSPAKDSYPSPTDSVASISSVEGQTEATCKKNKKKKKRKAKSSTVHSEDTDPATPQVQLTSDQAKLKKKTSTSSLSDSKAIDASTAAMILDFVEKRQEDYVSQFLAASKTRSLPDLRPKSSTEKISPAIKAKSSKVANSEHAVKSFKATNSALHEPSLPPAKVTSPKTTIENRTASLPSETTSQKAVVATEIADDKVKPAVWSESTLGPDVGVKVTLDDLDQSVAVPQKSEFEISLGGGRVEHDESDRNIDPAHHVLVSHNRPITPIPVPRYDFYQTATSVVISIYIKNLRQDEVVTTLKPCELVVSITTEQTPISVVFALPHAVNDETTTSVRSMKVEISLHKAETRAWANLGIPKVEQLELAYFTPRESNAVREEFNEALESLCGSGHPLNGDKHDFGTLTDSILPDTMTSSNITIDSQMDELTTLTDENEDDLSEAQLAARATCVFTDNSDDESDLDQERIRSSLVYHSLLPRHTRSLSCNSETNDDGSLYEDGSKDGSSAGTPIRGRLTWLMRRGVGSRSVLSLSEEAGVDTAISTPTSTYSAYDYREFSNVADARIEELRQKFILSRPLSPLFDEAELEIATPNYDDDGNWVDALEGDEDMQRRESRVVPQMITPGVRTDSGYDEPGVITKRPNLTGMANIGNTCFLNCIVQCLNSFDSFVEYFLDQSFANDINLENPLSPSKGKIVRSFAKLLDGLHNGGPSCIRALAGPYVYPKDFLSILAQYAPQYEANQQHDAQEFLQFLLDTVHEEVNKIVKKPYIELPDFDDSADPNFVGSEFWNAHKARNDSIVVDQFQGMYRSKMTCEECGKTSVKCDPYMSLTVDLPELPIEIQFILVTKAMQKLKYQFNMRAESTVNDLYDEIARYLGIPSNCLQAAWLCESLIQVVFIPQTPIATILSRNYQRNFCVFEVEPNSSLFRLSHWKRRERSRSHYRPSYYGEGYSSSDDYETLGFPFFVSILEGTTESSVYPIILERLVEGSLIRSPVDTPLPDQLFSIEIREAGEELPDPRIDEKYSMFSQTGSVIVQWDNEEYWDDFFNEPFDLKVQGLTAERQGIGYRVSLEDCLRQHLQEEASVEWYCPRCKKHTNGSKKLDLWSIPSGGLIIHLKRFVQYGQTPYWVKTDGKVIFPIAPGALDMSDFVVSAGSAEKFELVGVANHWGGLTSGHYTALSKRGGQWYYFDDEKVERAGEDYLEACAGAAYVLFYKPCV